MKDLDINTLVFEGLKGSIIEAFFKQTQYWNPQTNNTTYYGGQATEVVKRIMDSAEFKTLTSEIAKDLTARKTEFSDLAVTALKAKTSGALEDLLKDGGYGGVSAVMQRHMSEHVSAVAKEIVQSDDRLKAHVSDLLEKKIGLGDWDIQINVNVVVTGKSA